MKFPFSHAAPKNIAIVSDFDRTISRAFYRGKEALTSIGAIRHSRYMPKKFKVAATCLYNTYRPFEASTTISANEKYKKMEEWYTKVHDLYFEHNFTKKLLQKIIAQDSVKLRHGVGALLRWAFQHNIPFIIVTAGHSDIIEGILRRHGMFYSNITIIGNRMEFDNKGNYVGYVNDLIHACNKFDYVPLAVDKSRNKLIVIGDALEDAQMCDDLTYAKILKFGFCHDATKKDVYEKAFHHVIYQDGSMQSVNKILTKIVE